MQREPIEVISYSGTKSDERPETFILRGLRIDVAEIIDQWIEERSADRTRRRYFRIKGSDGAVHRIYFDESVMQWFYAT